MWRRGESVQDSSEPDLDVFAQTEPRLGVTDHRPDRRVRELGEKATIAFILSIAGLMLPLAAIIAIVLGAIAHDQIDTERAYDRPTPSNPWMARAAIILGVIAVIGWVIVLVILSLAGEIVPFT